MGWATANVMPTLSKKMGSLFFGWPINKSNTIPQVIATVITLINIGKLRTAKRSKKFLPSMLLLTLKHVLIPQYVTQAVMMEEIKEK